jgi:CRP/FNR family cyclic AMP-dependent transcriptional regulator
VEAVDRRRPLPLSNPLFPAARMRQLAGGSTRRVRAGDLVLSQGDAVDRLHVVEEGVLRVSSVRPSGRRAVVAIIGPGEAFGLEWILPEADRVGPLLRPEVRAMVASRVISVPATSIFVALDSSPDLARWIACAAVRALGRLQCALARTLAEGVRERVLRVLEDLAAAHGRSVIGGTRIELPVTQELLASMVGATRESVNRALRDLSARGRVIRSGRAYLLPRDQGPEPGSS